jgi:hypothetical protein
VRHVDELELEIAQADAFAGLHRMQLDLFVESRLAQLVVGESHRQRRSVDRDLPDSLQLRNDVWQRPDVVLMAMRNGDAPQLRQSVLHVTDIGDDQVDASLPFLRELASGVDDDHVIPIFDGHHALADFADSSQGNHPQPAISSVTGTLLSVTPPAPWMLWRRGGMTGTAGPGARRPLGVTARSAPRAWVRRALPGWAGRCGLIAALLAAPVRKILCSRRSRASRVRLRFRIAS